MTKTVDEQSGAGSVTEQNPSTLSRVEQLLATRKLLGQQTWGRWKIDNTGVLGGDFDITTNGRTIQLLTLDELEGLKRELPNMELVSIFGQRVKAIDADDDVRGGFVAYGFLEAE